MKARLSLSILELINYFSISRDSNKKKSPNKTGCTQLVSVHTTQNYPFFCDDAPYFKDSALRGFFAPSLLEA